MTAVTGMVGFRHLYLDEVAAWCARYKAGHLPPVFEEMRALWSDLPTLEASLRDGRQYWGYPAAGDLVAVVAARPALGPSELNARTMLYLGSLATATRDAFGPGPLRLRSHPAYQEDIRHLAPAPQVDTFRRFLFADMTMPRDAYLSDTPPDGVAALWYRLWTEHEQTRGATTAAHVLIAEADEELAKPGQRWATIRRGGLIAGAARAVRVRDTVRDIVVLCGAYVLPEYRQAGIGLQLIDARLADAARDGSQEAVSQAVDPTSQRNLVRAGFAVMSTFYYVR